ncbi:MAG: hypothetical protein AAGE84_13600 [Cyanobacteria bacterium P01_G01_bin.39]
MSYSFERLGTGDWGLGTGDWGLGTGDWGLGTGDWGVKFIVLNLYLKQQYLLELEIALPM